MITSITLRDNGTNSTICCNPIYSACTLSPKRSGDSSPNAHVSNGSVYSLTGPNTPPHTHTPQQIPQIFSFNLPELQVKSSKSVLEHSFHLLDPRETWEEKKPAFIPLFSFVSMFLGSISFLSSGLG